MAMEHRKAIEWSIMMAEMSLDEGLKAKTSEMVQIWKEQGLELKEDIDGIDSKVLDNMKFADCLKIEESNLYMSILNYINFFKCKKILEKYL